MKVSIAWLKELVNLDLSVDELIHLLPLRSVSLKEITQDSIELDLKGYNRADFLSMRGVAQEVAAVTSSKVLFEEPQEANFAWNKLNLPPVSVEVKDPKLCPLYCVAKIEGLKIGKSPPEWIKKLEDCGIRSISNIADITNLIMLEYGQTIHAFDAAKITDETMIVRLASKGEKLITLDGKIRDLTEEDLLITDPQGILSLSGIMGGKDSEITENTHTILLEVAIFDPVSIRKSSQRFGLYSEASKRIQHGLTKTRLLQALDAAIRMYQDLGGKLTSISMVGDTKDQVKKVKLSQAKLNSLIGVDIEPEQVEQYLQRLGFKTERRGANIDHLRGGSGSHPGDWEVEVPYWRLDIGIEEDLIEEVARMYGYENIPAQIVSESKPLQKENPIFKIIFDLKQNLVNLGLTEIQTYSFFSTDVLNNFEFDKNSLVKIANPISSETQYLRGRIWPNLVEAVCKNIKHGFKDIAIFELGKVYHISKGLPEEHYRLSIALMNGRDNPIQELYQIFQNISKYSLGVKLLHPPGDLRYFHPTRQSDHLAEVHPRFINRFGVEKRIAVLEIELDGVRGQL